MAELNMSTVTSDQAINDSQTSTDASNHPSVFMHELMVKERNEDGGTSRRRIIKNLLIISLAWLLLFSAFQALTNLQSSLNKDQGLGTATLSVLYSALVISCMFIPPPMINKLGYKNTICISMCCYLVYILANFYPTWYTLVPASIVIGIGAAPLWAAKCAYLTATGTRYADLSFETPEAVITRFFGIFFMMFQTSQIWGNIIASTVLHGAGNLTGSDNEIEHCGATFCDHLVGNATNLQRPDEWRVYLLMGIYSGCSVLALIVILVFLDQVPHRMSTTENSYNRLFVETFRHLRHKNQILIIPLTIYSGMEQGFVGGDFTKAYVSCSLGIWMVGYVMICYGVVDAACSYLFGKLVKYTGRLPCFTGGAVVHLLIQIGLLAWKPHPDNLALYFIFAALWGACDAIWQTQINALYGCIFAAHEQEAAFANYRLWESVGFIVAFAYSSLLCTNVKLYILMAMLAFGTAGYCAVELRERKPEETDDSN